MDKSFDDLYNEFFSDKNGQPIKPESNLNPDEIPQVIKDDIAAAMKVRDNLDENVIRAAYGDEMVAEYGPPDETEYYYENGVNYERLTWFRSEGYLSQVVIVKDSDTGMDYPKKKASLEEQLKDALEIEDYMKAAQIRDLILQRGKTT